MNPFSKLLDYIFPRRCIFCNTPIYSDLPNCEECAALIPFAEDVCPTCGKASCICGRQRLYFTAAASVFLYDTGVENAVCQLKFHDRVSYAKPLAGYLHQKLIQTEFADRIDLILPAPMTKKDIADRGYNQSILLAKELSGLSRIPMNDTALIKIKQTKKQHNLNAAERRRNLLDAFWVAEPATVCGRTILLCDDVYTTGSTLNECARTLMKSGAQEVFCLTVASAQLQTEQSEEFI